MANLANTAEMFKAVVQMIESARGRMIASACAGPVAELVGIEVA
jgi:hypothetical protein